MSQNTTSSAQTGKASPVADFLAGARKNSNSEELVAVPSDVLDVIKTIKVVRSMPKGKSSNSHLYLQIETTKGSVTGSLHWSLIGIAEPGDTLLKKNLQWLPTPFAGADGVKHYTFCGILE